MRILYFKATYVAGKFILTCDSLNRKLNVNDYNFMHGVQTISLSHAMRPGLKSAIFGWQND